MWPPRPGRSVTGMDINLPELPGWLRFLVHPGRLVTLAVVVLVGALEHARRDKRKEGDR